MAQALDIFRGYVEQKEHLGVIQLWLRKAVQDPHRANTMEIWELLGDAALENGSSERAIYAYAKAIHLIL
jgi:cytochrome c-type biogenesis protein CcmH/NrfG